MTKKIIISVISVLVLTFVGCFIGINWKSLKTLMSGAQIYTKSQMEESYNQGYEDANTNEDTYITQIDYYKNLVEDNELELINYKNQVTNLTNSNNDYVNQVNSLNQTIQTKEETISNLQSLVDTNDIIIAELKVEIANYENQIAVLENENSNMSSDLENKQEQINTLNLQISEKQTLINQLEDSNSNYVNRISTLNNQISLLNSQIETLQLEKQNNNTTIYELNNKITNLENSISYYENYILELENQNHIVAVFEFNGGVYQIKEVDENNKVTIENPISTEYIIFNYWTVDGVQINLEDYEIVENTKFVADVTYKYQINFLVDDEIVNSQIIEKDNYVIIPPEPIKDKYNFLGWSIDGVNAIDLSSYIVSSDSTFIALFESKYGLFNPDTGALIYSWSDLIDFGYITVDENNSLGAGEKVQRMYGDFKISSDVTSVKSKAFKDCTALFSVDFGEGVVTIGDQAFVGCTSIEKVTYHSNTTNFGSQTFFSTTYGGYKGNIKFIDYIGTIEDWCKLSFANMTAHPFYYARFNSYTAEISFNGVPLPKTLELPNSITEINPYAFGGFGCEIKLSNNIKKIGKAAFWNCLFTEMVLPNSLEQIDASAFMYCRNLTSIYIPSSVQVMGDKVFAYLTDINIYYEGDVVPSGWSETWNYSDDTLVLDVKYGYTYDEYLAEIGA